MLALLALVQKSVGRRTALVLMLGVAGCALFFGDAIITPAISVLSAVEGLELVTPDFQGYVDVDRDRHPHRAVRDPVARNRGSRPGSSDRSPRSGSYHGRDRALSCRGRSGRSCGRSTRSMRSGSSSSSASSRWWCSGAVFLAVTGAEALYADLGHFGRLADPDRVVQARLPVPGSQLPRPGCDGARRTRPIAATRSS